MKSLTVSSVSPSICHDVMGPDAMILVFWMLSFSQLFHSPLLLSSRLSLVLVLCFLPEGWYHLHIWGYWYFPGNLDSSLCFIQLSIQKTKIMASGPITSWEIDGETVEKVTDFIFWGSKITADSDWSHEIKRHLLLERKAMTNLDSMLKSRDITLPTKVHLVKAMAFPVVMYRCESWTVKKAERRRIDAFELWCWRRLLRVPWTARRSN